MSKKVKKRKLYFHDIAKKQLAKTIQDKVYDHEMAQDYFVIGLKSLCRHMARHRIHANWQRDVDSLKLAIQKLEALSAAYGTKEEERLVQEAFTYIGQHLMEWWD